jgi:hypothetical protein
MQQAVAKTGGLLPTAPANCLLIIEGRIP